MAKFIGKVVKVFSKPLSEKELAQPNNIKYGSSHKHSLQVEINGELKWVGFGSNKMESFMVQDDSDQWVTLGIGSEVVFKYTENGDFLNASKSDLVVMDLVVGEKYVAPSQAAPKPTTAGGPAQKVDWDANQKRITFGMCFNNACNQLGSSYNPEVLRERVVELYALAQEGSLLATKDNLASWGSAKEETPVSTAKASAKPKPSTAAKKPVVVEEEIEGDEENSPF